jgi:hypothetical protein
MLALLPAITYMGHWPLAGMDVHIDTTADSSALEDHEAHCHVGVSHCAGGEAMVGSIWAGEESNLLSLNSPHVKVETDFQTSARDGEPSRILQPPRAA